MCASGSSNYQYGGALPLPAPQAPHSCERFPALRGHRAAPYPPSYVQRNHSPAGIPGALPCCLCLRLAQSPSCTQRDRGSKTRGYQELGALLMTNRSVRSCFHYSFQLHEKSIAEHLWMSFHDAVELSSQSSSQRGADVRQRCFGVIRTSFECLSLSRFGCRVPGFDSTLIRRSGLERRVGVICLLIII